MYNNYILILWCVLKYIQLNYVNSKNLKDGFKKYAEIKKKLFFNKNSPLHILYQYNKINPCIQVTITDGSGVSRQSTVWVIVHIEDENDNKPEFPQRLYCISLPERDQNKLGDPVHRVFANDADEGSNAELTYSIVDGNEDGKFFIDAKTAMVYSRKMVTAGAYDILTVHLILSGRHLIVVPTTWLKSYILPSLFCITKVYFFSLYTYHFVSSIICR